MRYYYHSQPGCGGCLLLLLLFVLLLGGTPLLFDLLGVLFFGAVFVVLSAAAAFYAFTYYIKRRIAQYEKSQTEAHNKFVFLLIHILVYISKIDGVVHKEEINTITNFFRTSLHYNQSQIYWVKEMIKQAVATSHDLEYLLTEFKSGFAYEPRLILLELIYQVIFSKISVSDSELNAALNIADYLDINAYDLQSIRSRYMGAYRKSHDEETGYYEILGLQPGATFEEIKSAYRKLSMKYHPDKVSHLGDEFRSVAEEKMKAINQAYNHLKQKFRNNGS